VPKRLIVSANERDVSLSREPGLWSAAYASQDRCGEGVRGLFLRPGYIFQVNPACCTGPRSPV